MPPWKFEHAREPAIPPLILFDDGIRSGYLAIGKIDNRQSDRAA
jgi:hypothetical protein